MTEWCPLLEGAERIGKARKHWLLQAPQGTGTRGFVPINRTTVHLSRQPLLKLMTGGSRAHESEWDDEILLIVATAVSQSLRQSIQRLVDELVADYSAG
jgi:hypothetical protein